MKLAGLQTAPHRARAGRARAGRARRRAAASCTAMIDRRSPRRRAAADRPRRPRPASAQVSGGDGSRHEHRPPPRSPTMRPISSSSTTTAASVPCCRASCWPKATASPRRETAADARAKLAGLQLRSAHSRRDDAGRDRASIWRATCATSSSVPIIMLTARDEAKSRIEGLEIGADDYVGKPFEPRELLAAHRRHPAPCPAGGHAVRRDRCGSASSPSISRAASCERGDEIVRLTDRERDMLRMLAATPGETVPRLALAGTGGGSGERAVDVQVNRLRRKIETRSGQSAAGADRARHRLPAGDGAMRVP